MDNIRYRVVKDTNTANAVEVISDKDKETDKTKDNYGWTPDSRYKGEVNIPATVTDGSTTYTVIGIGDSAFYGAPITGITLPEGLEYIESAAFGGSSLTEITIPASVTRIGSPTQRCARPLHHRGRYGISSVLV